MFTKFAVWLSALLFDLSERVDEATTTREIHRFGEARGVRLFGYRRIGKTEYVRPLDSMTWHKVGDK